MDEALKRKILTVLDQHRDMSLATVRPDGWPQATTVGYANDGLTLYFLCSPDSQKAANLGRDDRVSLTIDDETSQVMEITGLSMAARAKRVTDPAEGVKALDLLMSKYANQAGLPEAEVRPTDVSIFRLTPTVISVLDYAKGFGHTDLVTCTEAAA
jgi:nitroimidazol reductase NimA-like FMN-containing flavoprotein (pyridoxamine 5'-phosphate oxidase superfamily)